MQLKFKAVMVNGKQRIMVTKIATGNDKTNQAVDYIMKEYEHNNSSSNKNLS